MHPTVLLQTWEKTEKPRNIILRYTFFLMHKLEEMPIKNSVDQSAIYNTRRANIPTKKVFVEKVI